MRLHPCGNDRWCRRNDAHAQILIDHQTSNRIRERPSIFASECDARASVNHVLGHPTGLAVDDGSSEQDRFDGDPPEGFSPTRYENSWLTAEPGFSTTNSRGIQEQP